MKKIAAIGGIIFLCGIIVTVIAFAVADWDYKKLSTRATLEERSATYDYEDQDITLLDKSTKVIINNSNDEKIHVSYQESEDLHYNITATSDIIKFEKKDDYKWYQYIFTFDFQWPTITISLPDGYSGTLDLKTTNSRIELKNLHTEKNITIRTTNDRVKLENIDAQKIDIQTTNDPVELKNVKSAGDLKIKTTNDKVTLENVEATGNLTIETTNDRVTLENVKAQKIDASTTNDKIQAKNTASIGSTELKTKNGVINITNLKSGGDIVLKTTNDRIEGTIIGKMSDYKITSKTTHGNNSLPTSKTSGTHNLTVTTTNDNINVIFTIS